MASFQRPLPRLRDRTPCTTFVTGVPPGHVTVNGTPAQIRAGTVDDPALPDLGLKRLDDGSYRLPK